MAKPTFSVPLYKDCTLEDLETCSDKQVRESLCALINDPIVRETIQLRQVVRSLQAQVTYSEDMGR